MTEIEKQVFALLNEVGSERNTTAFDTIDRRKYCYDEAFCRLIERHEAFKQEVSDAAAETLKDIDYGRPLAAKAVLGHFILTTPDPLAEAIRDCQYVTLEAIEPEFAKDLRAALAARNLEIVEKKP